MARLLRTVVCSYQLGELPTSWLIVFHRLERALQRAGYRVWVRLAPLERLPAEPFEILVVPTELRQAAEASGTGAEVIGLDPPSAAAAIEAFLARFGPEGDLSAEALEPDEPVIARYRGLMPL
ncbi:MAG: hypothetical protein KGJ86_20545 [Chloroflexota bacterium]|nr:hypothetical protein [Chloroflexota bacterium]